MKMITDWFRYQFNNPQVVFLTLFLVLLFVVVVLMGNMLAPLLTAVVIAYLLEGLVGVLEKTRLPRLIAVLVVYFAFLLFVVLILFGLLPLLSQQATLKCAHQPLPEAAVTPEHDRTATYLGCCTRWAQGALWLGGLRHDTSWLLSPPYSTSI